MHKEPSQNAPINFSLHDGFADLVIVRRVLPNGKTESIGKIYQHFRNDEGQAIYGAVNKDGEGLHPPTEDFGEVEDAFQKYANQLAEKSLAEEREKRWMVLADRSREVENIRQRKNQKEIKQEITR